MCDVCGATDADVACRLVTFADYVPLPEGMVGHPDGVHWLCEPHAAALEPLRDRTWARAVATLAPPDPEPTPAIVSTPATVDLEWRDGDGWSGVHDREGDLLWWSRPGGPNGRFGEAAGSQALADYRANGPMVSCPAHVEAELDRAVGRTR